MDIHKIVFIVHSRSFQFAFLNMQALYELYSLLIRNHTNNHESVVSLASLISVSIYRPAHKCEPGFIKVDSSAHW